MTINTTATIAQLSTAYVVYGVYVADQTTLIYLGACPLHSILELGTLGRNPVFAKAVTRDTPLTIKELARWPDKQSAQTDLASRLATGIPACNTVPTPTRIINRGKRVRDVQSGLIYDNAAQAAAAIETTPATMSNHLTGRRGYETIRGKTFERLED